MKASELRIGNLVEYKIHGKDEWVVAPIFSIHFEKDFSKNFRPIPLTPEILEKAGFDCDDNFEFIAKNCRLTKNSNGGFAYWIGIEGGFLADIFYLHQLQNLHFALTGEELTIKELPHKNAGVY